MRRWQLAGGSALAGLLAATAGQAHAQTTTERVSIAASGAQPAGGRYTPRPAISADGTVVAFESPVATLVAADTNLVADIFVSTGGVVSRLTGNGGVQPDCASARPSVSGNGQLVAFESCATNLVPGDTNNFTDVFVFDRNTSTVTRVSVATGGTQGNGSSFSPAISPNGRFVAFVSQASNLGGGGVFTHTYLHDLLNGTTVLASRLNDGTPLIADVRPAVADDGTVAFVTATNVGGDTNNLPDVYLRTTTAPTTTRVSVRPGGQVIAAGSSRPSISADGQLVAFETAGDGVNADVNGLSDIYVRDRTNATTVLISRIGSGSGGNGPSTEASISADGLSIVFTSLATDLGGAFDLAADVFRASLSRAAAVAVTGISRVSVPTTTTAAQDSGPAVVANGGRVAFASDEAMLVAGDDNGDTDVFAADAGSLALTRLSVFAAGQFPTYSGRSLRPVPSYDGTIVAFLSTSTTLVSGDTNGRTDVFVRDRVTGATARLPIPAGYEKTDADWLSISHDGRFIAYARGAVFLYDRLNGTTITVSSATPGGTVVAGAQPRISPSGRYVAYVTGGAFDAADTNGRVDVYRWDRLTGAQVLISRATGAGVVSNGDSTAPVISGDGSTVAFASTATNLVAGDANGRSDIFVRHVGNATTVRVSTNLDPEPGTIEARDPYISADGQYVAFLHTSSILTTETTATSNVFVVRSDGTGVRGPLSGVTEGVATAEGSFDPTLSMFGRFLGFRSYSPNLVAGDTNGAADVFGRQILGAPATPSFGTVLRVSLTEGGAQAVGGNGIDTENPEIGATARTATFQSGFSNLVTGDTNAMVDGFIRVGIFGNGECDFIEATIPGYAAWLAQFGLDPCTNGGSPWSDPDGDGSTNEEEYEGGGDGDPTLGVFTRYFAEGATKTAGLNFDTRIALANPSGAVVTGEISYQLPSGIAVPVTPFTLQPYERATVQLDDQLGIDEDGPDFAYEFSTTVKASAPIGVDRTMTWDKSTYAGHAETGVVSAARKWYFAEGATIGGFNLFYLLQNPSNTPATVEARFLLGTGAVYSKTYVLTPNSRSNVWANVESINGGTPLANAELSAEFTVTSGDPIIAERAMYRGSSPLFKAGHESAGITEPATEWFLAEGNAGDFFDHFVLIGNTTSNAALVQADFIVGNSGTIYTRQYTVIPNSRFNIWVDEEEITPGVRPFRTGNTDVSVRIRSLNGVPLIVERAMWWPGSSNTWYEAHNSPASARTAGRWVVAEGENGGPLGWNTYILVANTGTTGGTVRIRLLLPNGVTNVLTGQPIPAQSRTTYFLGDLLTAAGLPADTPAGVLIESEGATLPLVVERAMYRNVNGITFQVGTNALGTPLP